MRSPPAAIQPSYAILLHTISGAQSGMLATQRNASLAALEMTQEAHSIAAGVAW